MARGVTKIVDISFNNYMPKGVTILIYNYISKGKNGFILDGSFYVM